MPPSKKLHSRSYSVTFTNIRHFEHIVPDSETPGRRFSDSYSEIPGNTEGSSEVATAIFESKCPAYQSSVDTYNAKSDQQNVFHNDITKVTTIVGKYTAGESLFDNDDDSILVVYLGRFSG